ncbi:Na+/melibiose symporter [Anaerocolumna jejuensis DSM 15929]|uniref:Na+/melibiose symporter n=1 Tax=Anaerocolumna jejuensis DSM 15929 TaxID=1121322 RepID=A0A1M7DHG7_9FIRM|nr:MFS transporter [Anaerocolumna jejuensis]SHL78964.1 Na+/melibiose symporter [Anaerocolumna jejuensis DSM 15929]
MKLNYKRTFLISLAFMSICAFWQLYDTIIPLMLQNTFKLGETVTGTVMALDNVLAIFLLPVFGAYSDKVNTKLGKRTPFILFGTISAVVLMMILPAADMLGNMVLFVTTLLLLLVAMGSYRSPAVALMPDVTPKPLRSKANAVINLMGAAGGVFSLVMIKLLVKQVDKPDYIFVFLAVAALMLISVMVLVSRVKENKLAVKSEEEEGEGEEQSGRDTGKLPKEVQRSLIFILVSIFLWFMAYNAVTTAFSRYAVKVWDLKGGSFANCLLVATIAAIISYIPIGMLSGKFGRKNTIIGGILLLTASYFTGMLFQEFSVMIYLVFAVTGIGWAAINVNSYPMVVEMSKGSEVGKYTGLYYTFSMSAQIITPIVSGFLLEHISYYTLFPYAVVFSLLSLCTMLLVKHGDARPEKRSSLLENFDS